MPRSAEASAAVREATRARIRRAAVLVMAERGYRATTLRQVAEAAGVAAGLPSRYFGGKAGLLLDVAEGWRRRTRAALAAKEPSGDPAATVRLLVRAALLGLDGAPEDVREGRAVSALLADPQARDVLRAAGADVDSADLLDALRDALAAAGSADPDGDHLVLLAGIRGGLVLVAEDPGFPLRALEQALVERVLPGRDGSG